MRDFWYTMSGNKNMPDLSVWFDSLIMKEKTYSITATLISADLQWSVLKTEQTIGYIFSQV